MHLLKHISSMSIIKHCFIRFTFYIVECPSGTYGINCKETCSINCNVSFICKKTTEECIGGCQPGWKRLHCDQSIPLFIVKWKLILFFFYFHYFVRFMRGKEKSSIQEKIFRVLNNYFICMINMQRCLESIGGKTKWRTVKTNFASNLELK